MNRNKMFDEAVDTLYTLLEKATGGDNLLTAKGAVAFGTVFGRIIMPKLEELEAENRKLRAAFEEILEHDLDGMLDPHWAHNIARAALND